MIIRQVIVDLSTIFYHAYWANVDKVQPDNDCSSIYSVAAELLLFLEKELCFVEFNHDILGASDDQSSSLIKNGAIESAHKRKSSDGNLTWIESIGQRFQMSILAINL